MRLIEGAEVSKLMVKSSHARQIMERCHALGEVSDESDCLTRTFASPAMRRTNRMVASWMDSSGLQVRQDAAFNLIGRIQSSNPRAKCLVIGSHLDTVRNAGKFDGPLGVLIGLAVAQEMKGKKMPFHLEVVGFSDEEGVRYQTTYLGSRAMLGRLTKRDLSLIEEKGIEKAKRPQREFLAYLEAHIEQGPVLESQNIPLGVVTGIHGQTRISVTFRGQAGHAGTTPMNLRHDALCGAAEVILEAENSGMTATVGQCEVVRSSSNVIPGQVLFTLDVRDSSDTRRRAACAALREKALAVAQRRGLKLQSWKIVQETSAIAMDNKVSRILQQSAGAGVPMMPSGAGHDAAVMARACPSAMLFIRCRKGVSHHPSESVKPSDVASAVAAMARTVLELARVYE